MKYRIKNIDTSKINGFTFHELNKLNVKANAEMLLGAAKGNYIVQVKTDKGWEATDITISK